MVEEMGMQAALRIANDEYQRIHEIDPAWRDRLRESLEDDTLTQMYRSMTDIEATRARTRDRIREIVTPDRRPSETNCAARRSTTWQRERLNFHFEPVRSDVMDAMGYGIGYAAEMIQEDTIRRMAIPAAIGGAAGLVGSAFAVPMQYRHMGHALIRDIVHIPGFGDLTRADPPEPLDKDFVRWFDTLKNHLNNEKEIAKHGAECRTHEHGTGDLAG
jgi:hypothetical protein